ncbi:hypothetical protein M3484_12965 [Pseudomonas sp. GX19020]|uniref:hypothetical protein n=1 Tax=Pseudomonadota TaxID=1224 RepID=UPI00089B626A|nr:MULTISPECIES: hypothetical protein [Pseudomonadota]MCL4067482.1 hypothetical protein [Pseudomonas sp. GX19020]SED82242.1 hypothetical protein SAMN05519105_4639 [Rhodobacter sp. 24-YEA-8]
MAEAADDIRANLEKQITDLKKEVSRMSKSLASRASDAMDDAEDAFEEGKGRARQVASQVREQASLTVGAMRENPGTTATVLTSVGLMGVAAGFVLAGLCASDRRR